MAQLGMTVMINTLFGDDRGAEEYKSSLNKQIEEVSIKDNTLKLRFTDGSVLSIWDGGQSCCECRYMVCDDVLSQYSGATFTGVRLLDGDDEPCEDGDHEVQFLIIDTSKGSFTVSNHNEHNGYYGGFWIKCGLVEANKG